MHNGSLRLTPESTQIARREKNNIGLRRDIDIGKSTRFAWLILSQFRKKFYFEIMENIRNQKVFSLNFECSDRSKQRYTAAAQKKPSSGHVSRTGRRKVFC